MRVKKFKKIKKVEVLSLGLILSISLTACGGSKTADLSNIRSIEQINKGDEVSETKKIETEKKVEFEKEIKKETGNDISNNYNTNKVVNSNDIAYETIDILLNDLVNMYIKSDGTELSLEECNKIINDSYYNTLNYKNVPLIALFKNKGIIVDNQSEPIYEQMYECYGSYYENSAEQIITEIENGGVISCENKISTKMDGDFVSCVLKPLEDVPENSPFKLETFNVKEASLNILFNELGFSIGDLLESSYEVIKGYNVINSNIEYEVIYFKNKDKYAVLTVQDDILADLTVMVPYNKSEIYIYDYSFYYRNIDKDDYYEKVKKYLVFQFCMCNSLTDTIKNIWDARLSEDDKLKLEWDTLINDQEFYLLNAQTLADMMKDTRESETNNIMEREIGDETLENSREPWLDHSKNQVYIDKYGYKAYPLSYYVNDDIDGLIDLYNKSIEMFNSELNETVDYMYFNDLDVDIDTSLEDSTKIYEPGETTKVVGIIHQFSEKYDDFVHVYFIINLKNTENIGVAMKDMCIVGLDSPDNY